MKLLQVNASYKPAYIYGGPTMSVSKLSEEMAKTGCTVEVFTTTANGPAELPVTPGEQVDLDGVKVIYFTRITKDHSHFSPSLFKKLWKDARQFDVIHIHAWWNLVSVFSCWLALKRGMPVVVSPRGTLSAYSFTNKNSLPKKIMHSWLGKSLLKRSYIHTTSEREKAAMEALISSKKVFNIPNFIVLPEHIPAEPPKQGDKLRLIFFSRIEEKKGLEILLNALTHVIVPYHLTIAGDGNPAYVNSLKTLADKNELTGHISWIGFQKNNKFSMLQKHDLMVLPSYDENFGNVVIESLSIGTAVLLSKFVGLADYVQKNDLGWIADHNETAFGNAINNIYEQSGQLSGIRQKAPAKIREDFNEHNLAQKYLDMYNQIIANG